MGDVRAIGDDLPQLIGALAHGEFSKDEVLGFAARTVDYEIFWVECYPERVTLHEGVIILPVTKVTLAGDELESARHVRLYPETQTMEVLDRYGQRLHMSSPINLITPSVM